MALHIAIDGPAGAGKSTIAKAVAQTLSIPYLDTGAMYRTLALFALRNGVSPQDGQGVEAILPRADIRIFYRDGVQHMLLNGEDVTGSIRTPEVSRGASDIGVHPKVREKLVELQQQVARQGDVVMDGRDICTFVMPHAEHKFFVTATARERAMRRRKEMLARGETPPSVEEMERDILARDYTDSTRACNPLKKTEDAELIDTTGLTIEQGVQRVLDAINRA
ncbi:MAG TPA: (d)CMP kinase [Feifaniaceae bacterium]|nr:(d)CMP kinase [Feifaniaceae bacterium]